MAERDDVIGGSARLRARSELQTLGDVVAALTGEVGVILDYQPGTARPLGRGEHWSAVERQTERRRLRRRCKARWAGMAQRVSRASHEAQQSFLALREADNALSRITENVG